MNKGVALVLAILIVVGVTLSLVWPETGALDDALVQASTVADVERPGSKSSPADEVSAPEPDPVPLVPETVAVAAPIETVDRSPRPAANTVVRIGPEVPQDGRTGTLVGRITVEGKGTRAELTFGPGPNRERTFVTGDDGAFSVPELYPGLSLLTATVPGGKAVTREVVLPHYGPAVVNLDFTQRADVVGQVTSEGQPVPGASLMVDGRSIVADNDGRFTSPVVASGAPLLIVDHPGFAKYREELSEARTGPIRIRVEPECTLDLKVSSTFGLTGLVDVYLFPVDELKLGGVVPESSTPWHLVNPMKLRVGEPRRLEGLPSTRVKAYAFHSLARGRPTSLWLSPDRHGELTIWMDAVPRQSGQVLRDGEAVTGARIVLQYANTMTATQRLFAPDAVYLKAHPFEIAPLARQETLSDADGAFTLGVDERIGGLPYLTVESPGRDVVVTKQLRPGRAPLVVDLGVSVR